MNALGFLRHRAPRLRTMLVLLALTVAVPCALLAAGMLWFGYERAVTRTYGSALAGARSSTVRVEQRFNELRHALEALAASPSLDGGDLAEFRVHALRFLATNGMATNVTLVTADGLQVLNTARPESAAPIPARPELVALFSSGEFAVTPLVEGRVLGPVIVAGVPARRGGKVVYVVGEGIQPGLLGSVIGDGSVPASWTVSILDSQGRIVARRPHRDEYIGKPATPELLAALHQRDEALLRTTNREGLSVFAAFSRAAGSRYSVAVGAPVEELLGEVRKIAGIVIAIIVAVIALSVSLALRVGGEIARGIRALTAAAKGIGREQLPSGRLGFHEAEQLRIGLNITAAELQQATDELRGLRDETRRATAMGMQSLLKSVWEPFVLADHDGRIVAMNDAAIEWFGPVPAGDAWLSLEDIFRPDEGEKEGASIRGHALLRDREPVACEVRSSVFEVNDCRFVGAGFRREPKEGSSAERYAGATVSA